MVETKNRPSKITNVPPSYDSKVVKTGYTWLEAKRDDDNCEGLWRIHNHLYDLTDFIDKHPGGSDWLEFTKGTDITEAFEAHHIFQDKLTKLLDKYRVREITTPRNVKLTFREDGFYYTLRKRVVKKLPQLAKSTPQLKSKVRVLLNSSPLSRNNHPDFRLSLTVYSLRPSSLPS